jgi:hypothetical protein
MEEITKFLSIQGDVDVIMNGTCSMFLSIKLDRKPKHT